MVSQRRRPKVAAGGEDNYDFDRTIAIEILSKKDDESKSTEPYLKETVESQ
jgi:hypothetical protein